MSVNEQTNTVVIVDDHPLFRGAMAQALSQPLEEGGTSVSVLEAGDFGALLEKLKSEDQIDLVLLDLAMPGVSGFSGLLTLRAEYSDVPVVIVSATDDPATINRAMALGASGFIPKSSPIETIRGAISAVLALRITVINVHDPVIMFRMLVHVLGGDSITGRIRIAG